MASPDKLQPDEWYIKMMIKRLRMPKCEERDQVIALFRTLWPNPKVSNRAEEFYDRALTHIQETDS